MEEEENKEEYVQRKERVWKWQKKQGVERKVGEKDRKKTEQGRKGCVKGESGELAQPAQGKGVPQARRARLRPGPRRIPQAAPREEPHPFRPGVTGGERGGEQEKKKRG